MGVKIAHVQMKIYEAMAQGKDVAEAQAKLDDAQAKLQDATNAYSNGNCSDAITLAGEAKQLAQDAGSEDSACTDENI